MGFGNSAVFAGENGHILDVDRIEAALYGNGT